MIDGDITPCGLWPFSMPIYRTLLVLFLLPTTTLSAPPELGLRGEYFADRSFTTRGTVRRDGPIDFTFEREPPYQGDKLPEKSDGHYVNFSIR